MGKLIHAGSVSALLSRRRKVLGLVKKELHVSGNHDGSECLVSVLGGGASGKSQSAPRMYVNYPIRVILGGKTGLADWLSVH